MTSDGLCDVGRAADFKALQQLLLDSNALLLQMEAAICSLNASHEVHLYKVKQKHHKRADLVHSVMF